MGGNMDTTYSKFILRNHLLYIYVYSSVNSTPYNLYARARIPVYCISIHTIVPLVSITYIATKYTYYIYNAFLILVIIVNQ